MADLLVRVLPLLLRQVDPGLRVLCHPILQRSLDRVAAAPTALAARSLRACSTRLLHPHIDSYARRDRRPPDSPHPHLAACPDPRPTERRPFPLPPRFVVYLGYFGGASFLCAGAFGFRRPGRFSPVGSRRGLLTSAGALLQVLGRAGAAAQATRGCTRRGRSGGRGRRQAGHRRRRGQGNRRGSGGGSRGDASGSRSGRPSGCRGEEGLATESA